MLRLKLNHVSKSGPWRFDWSTKEPSLFDKFYYINVTDETHTWYKLLYCFVLSDWYSQWPKSAAVSMKISCWPWNVLDKLGQHSGCWCPGSMHCLVISIFDIDSVYACTPGKIHVWIKQIYTNVCGWYGREHFGHAYFFNVLKTLFTVLQVLRDADQQLHRKQLLELRCPLPTAATSSSRCSWYLLYLWWVTATFIIRGDNHEWVHHI